MNTFRRSADELLNLTFSVPSDLRHWPIHVLGLPVRLQNSVEARGLKLLGDLHEKTPADLLGPGIGVKGIKDMQESLARLSSIPALEALAARDADGRSLPPRLSTAMLLRVSAARSLAEETDALLSNLNGRNAQLVRDRWTVGLGDSSTLDEIGQRYGITRERVRQIVARQDKLLRGSNVRLRIASLVVQILERFGGGLTTPRLVRELRSEGINVMRSDLGVLPTLSELGLTGGRLVYSGKHRLWLSESGITQWLDTKRLDALNRDLAQTIRARLQQTGSIGRRALRRLSPFGLSHALRSCLRRKTRLLRVDNHILPIPSMDCSVTRAVSKMLSVTPQMSIADIHAGLRQMPRIDIPPLNVLHALLSNHTAFVVDGDVVTPAGKLARANVLSPAEEAAVVALERAGGLLLWTELDEAIQEAGFSHAMFSVIVRRPFIVRRAIGIYGLRGQRNDQVLMRRKHRERAAARRDDVVRARRVSADIVEVEFTVTRFSLYGALSLPSSLRRPGTTQWRAILPGGRQRLLTERNGFLSGTGQWLREVGAEPGDIVVASFYVAEARIEFNEPIMQRSA